MTANLLVDETPVDYEEGRVWLSVEDGEDVADLVATSAKGVQVVLRLDRDELADLISAAAKTLAALR